MSYAVHAQPQWCYRVVGKAPDGTLLDLRGIGAALTGPSYGARLEADLPARPWESAPEITRG